MLEGVGKAHPLFLTVFFTTGKKSSDRWLPKEHGGIMVFFLPGRSNGKDDYQKRRHRMKQSEADLPVGEISPEAMTGKHAAFVEIEHSYLHRHYE
jgi:hypothetical protein